MERIGKAGEQEGSDDKGKKFVLKVAAFYLEGCLSKEIWELCERQTGVWGEIDVEESEPTGLRKFSKCLRLFNLIEKNHQKDLPCLFSKESEFNNEPIFSYQS